MSSGRQLRDYLHINTLAEYYSAVLENPECNGIINCCSGIPISVYELVIKRCQEKSSNIKINRDYFPMPDYEPLKYWGVPSKLRSLGIKE